MPTAKSTADLPSLEQTLSMSGLEFMQGLLNRTIAWPPMWDSLGYRLTAVEPGRIVFNGVPEFQHSNPAGSVHGGWYGTVLDSCMACAVMTGVQKGSVYTTLEYKINIVRAVPIGMEITAIGLTDHVGRSTGVAHGQIRGAEDGELYATGSTTCLVMAVNF